MTREEFKDLWNIEDIKISSSNAMTYVMAEVKYKDDDLLLNFDLFTEDEVYALGYDFFKQLKKSYPNLTIFQRE